MKALSLTGERVVPDLQKGDPIVAEHLLRYLWCRPLVRGKTVLDVACGSGYGARILADAGATEVVGADRDSASIAYARERYGTSNIRFLEADACALPFHAPTFDVVVSFETIEHLSDPMAFLREVRRVLWPRGILVLSTPNRAAGLPPNPFHVKEFSLEELERLLGSFFRVVECSSQENLPLSVITPAGSSRAAAAAPRTLRIVPLDPQRAPLSPYTLAVCSDDPVAVAPEVDGVTFQAVIFQRWLEQVWELSRERDTLSATLLEERAKAAAVSQQLHDVHASVSWALTAHLRRAKRQAKLLARLGRAVARNARPGIVLLFREGPTAVTRHVAYGYWRLRNTGVVSLDEQYAIWRRMHETRASGEPARILARLTSRPTISILLPTYNTPARILTETLASVKTQSYPHWELCIADDASTTEETKGVLRQAAAEDPRIRVTFRATNGHIAEASNTALHMATGEFIALLDHDDLLAPHALLDVARLLNAVPDLDMVYSDEDKLDARGQRTTPFFKPDWSPETFLSCMYTLHFGVYRTALVRELSGFRRDFEGSQDYDLVLRLTERTDRIAHLPKVLYHWRKLPSSAARSPRAKPYAYAAAGRALADALDRRGLPYERIEQGRWPGSYRLALSIQGTPLVSILIPTTNRLGVLRPCVETLLERTGYRNFELLILDHESTDPEALAYLTTLERAGRARVVPSRGPFNFSAVNNAGALQARGDVVVFLNNDTEISEGTWLQEMLQWAQRPEIGAVGARLVYPNFHLQHAGVVLGLGGAASHAHRGLPASSHGYAGLASIVRNVAAVTAACLMIERKKFWEAGGFDEAHFRICYNDVDLCLKLLELGYRNIYTPYATLLHYESATLGRTDEGRTVDEGEITALRARWPQYVRHDPYYNPNLTTAREDFSLALNAPPPDADDQMIARIRERLATNVPTRARTASTA